VATLPLTRFGQTAPKAPTLPKNLPVNKIVSVSAGGTRYRVLAVPDRQDTGTTVVAVPLRDVDQTLHRLLLVEALVIAAVLAALASIRGYAELYRMGAMEDTDTAMKRIEEEATRMGILVEDLLALARLDEIRDSRREPVALDALARDAVSDAQATAPDRAITL